ncbi:MAG: carbonic anhydrase [Terriglobales bacterium]
MKKLFEGVHRFHTGVIFDQKETFNRLAKGQKPETLFITCSDSRIDPALLTQTAPGEIFVIRNAGNLVPPHGSIEGGTGASIEFAVVGLNVTDIVICGHTSCGAIKGLLNPEALTAMPSVARWLTYADATREIIKSAYADVTEPEALQIIATQENVLVQLENLRTIPCVAAGLVAGTLKLHAWVFQIGTGEVYAYDPDERQYKLITESHKTPERSGRGRIKSRTQASAH